MTRHTALIQIPGKPIPFKPEGFSGTTFFLRKLSRATRRQASREALVELSGRTGIKMGELQIKLGAEVVAIEIGKKMATESVVDWQGVEAVRIDDPTEEAEIIPYEPDLLEQLDESILLQIYTKVFEMHEKDLAAEKKSFEDGQESTSAESSEAQKNSSPQTAASSDGSERSSSKSEDKSTQPDGSPVVLAESESSS